MSVSNMLVHTCDVYRKQRVEGKGLTSQFTKIAEGVPCMVTPQTEQSNIQGTIIIGKDYVAYFNEDADVKEGDKLVVSTGVSLFVNGEASYVDFPRISHKEFTCQTVGD